MTCWRSGRVAIVRAARPTVAREGALSKAACEFQVHIACILWTSYRGRRPARCRRSLSQTNPGHAGSSGTQFTGGGRSSAAIAETLRSRTTYMATLTSERIDDDRPLFDASRPRHPG
jgi:hypothetical protein